MVDVWKETPHPPEYDDGRSIRIAGSECTETHRRECCPDGEMRECH